jgi:hypothetical protein
MDVTWALVLFLNNTLHDTGLRFDTYVDCSSYRLLAEHEVIASDSGTGLDKQLLNTLACTPMDDSERELSGQG